VAAWTVERTSGCVPRICHWSLLVDDFVWNVRCVLPNALAKYLFWRERAVTCYLLAAHRSARFLTLGFAVHSAITIRVLTSGADGGYIYVNRDLVDD
jgi:hypothetical protein